MENWTSYQNRTYNNDVCKLLIYFLKNYKINNAIDLGCGSGNETVYMIKNGVKVEAIDRQLNKEFILNRLNDKEKEKISFLEQEFESIELKKADAKIILSSDCHDKEFLDCDFENTKMLLKDIGFSYIYSLYNNQFIKNEI